MTKRRPEEGEAAPREETANSSPSPHEVEGDIDAWWNAATIPSNTWGSAAYHLVAAVDDRVRLAAGNPPLGEHVARRYLVEGVYSLRRALAAARKQHGRSVAPLSLVIDDDGYRAATKLLDMAIGYEVACRAFGHYHAKNVRCSVDDSGCVSFERAPIDLSAAAYQDLSRQERAPTGTVADLVLRWMSSPGSLADVARQVSERVTVGAVGSVPVPVYEFDPTLAVRLKEALPPVESMIPLGWRFPWGEAHDVVECCRALTVRCVYHVVSIHFGSIRLGIPGLGLDTLPLALDRGAMVRDLEAISGVDEHTVLRMVSAWEFGTRTSPDQALQPLVPIGHDRLVAAALQVTALDHQRNLLVLHAREAASSFDAQSAAFERKMLAELQAEIAPLFPHCSLNLRVAGEEVDIIIVEPQMRVVLVVECFWTIPTADVREEILRARTRAKKVKQAGRKRDAVARSIPNVLGRLKCPADGDGKGWTVLAMVVVEGIAGDATRRRDGIPVAPATAFVEGLRAAQHLSSAFDEWLCARWAPVEGLHYDVRHSEDKVGRWTLRWPGPAPRG